MKPGPNRPVQLQLFANQEAGAIDLEKLERLLREAKQLQKDGKATRYKIVLSNSFTINPSPKIEKYFGRAQIASSAEESIANDWRKVCRDLYLSFLDRRAEYKAELEDRE